MTFEEAKKTANKMVDLLKKSGITAEIKEGENTILGIGNFAIYVNNKLQAVYSYSLTEKEYKRKDK